MEARDTTPLLAVAALCGAACAWLLDPVSGRRRRHMLRDRSAAQARRNVRRAGRFARHERAELHGLGQRVRQRLPHEQRDHDDATLAHKVESIVFRDREVPKGTINVNVERGVVYLRGEVESPDLLTAIAERTLRIEGVIGVKNLLHLPGAWTRPLHARYKGDQL